MTRVLLLLAAMVGLSAVAAARSHSTVDSATIDALARTYNFKKMATPIADCQVTLKREPALQRNGTVLRPIDFALPCRERFSSLRGITYWAATGGASVALFRGDPLTEASDFSPVQDGTGVYLRGGFSGDAGVYELRPLR